jgi:uncharacterized membrane protein YuzA (DUF378 family)
MSTQQTLMLIAKILCAVASINWALSVHGINLVQKVSFNNAKVEKGLYYVIGLAGAVVLYSIVQKLM